MHDDIHFYEPAKGHGLPHDPFNAIVGPRPIGWISSQDAQGRLNLAPYSFFNAFNYIPPIIGFCSVGRKDSLNNIEQTGEFVWNLATRPLAEAMNQSCAMVGPEVNEFELAGLSTVPSRVISVPRVPGILNDSAISGVMSCTPTPIQPRCTEPVAMICSMMFFALLTGIAKPMPSEPPLRE